jgi:hypothetical protein
MGTTRINSRLVGDGQINTIDMAVGACTGNRIKVGDGNKGDMIASDASANNITVPVGADGTVLSADSSQTPGVVWAVPRSRKLYASTTSSNSDGTSSSEVQFDQLYSLPANMLAVGDVIKLRFAGHYIKTGTATLTLRVYIGTSSFIDFGAFQPTSTGAQLGFVVDVSIIVDTIGSSGLVRGSGVLQVNGQSPVVSVVDTLFSMNTTAAKDLKMTGQWSVSSASNVAVLRSVDMELFH